MNIRKIIDSDLDECSKIYLDVFSNPPWNEKWNLEIIGLRLSHFYGSKGFIGLLAESEGSVLGFVLGNTEPFYFGQVLYLREMCVQQNQQRKGIGARLYCALEPILIENKVASVYLTTRTNTPASQFYHDLGFSIEKQMGFFTKELNSN